MDFYVSRSPQIIRRSQTDSARPLAGKLTLHAQVPRFLDDARRQGKQQQQQSRRDGDGRAAAGGLYDEDTRRGSNDGSLRSLPPLSVAAVEGHQEKRHHQAGVVSVTVSFVVAYSGPGEVRDATLNIVPPPGFSAEPSSVLLPPVRGSNGGGSRDTGKGGGGGGGGSGNEPIVVTVVLSAERGTQRLPSTLAGEASVVYTRQGTGGDGRCEPMSARCALLLPLALAGKVVEPVPRKGGGGSAHKFTFSTTRPAVPLSSLFEDMATWSSPTGDGGDGASSSPPTNRDAKPLEESKSNGAGGGAPAASVGDSGGEASASCSIGKESTAFSLRYWAVGADAEGGGQDVSVTVSKNSGRYRVQSESLPAICVMATEVARRLREYFGDHAGGRNRGCEEHPAADEGKTDPHTGEKMIWAACFPICLTAHHRS